MTIPKSERNLRWYLYRIRYVLHYEGASGFILRVAAFLGYKCGIWFVGWYVNSIANSVHLLDFQLPGEVVELTLADVDEYVSCNRIVTPAAFKKRITTGNRCYAVRRENQIVSACWVATDHVWVDFLLRDLFLRKGGIYLYDSNTRPSYRGQGLSKGITAEILKWYQAAGYHHACSFIAPENRSQIRARTRSGFKRTAWILTLKIGRFHWDSFKDR